MAKWIGGCLVAAVVVAACIAFWGYKKYVALTAGGGSTSVTIAASPARVFASLANADSVSARGGWAGAVTVSRHGMLVVGDTLHGEAAEPRTSGSGPRPPQFSWTVAQVETNRLLVLEMRNDSSGDVIAVQRDSLVGVGDSTMIISTVASPTIDSLRTAAPSGTGRPAGGAFLDVGAKLIVAAFRTQSEAELKRLKARIEGTPVPKTP